MLIAFVLSYLLIGVIALGYNGMTLYNRIREDVFTIPTGEINEPDKYLEVDGITVAYVSLASFDCSKSVFEHIQSRAVASMCAHTKKYYLMKDGKNIVLKNSADKTSTIVPENESADVVIRTGYTFPKPRRYPSPYDDDQYDVVCPNCLEKMSVTDVAFLAERSVQIDENRSRLEPLGVIVSDSGLWNAYLPDKLGTISEFGMSYEILANNAETNYKVIKITDASALMKKIQTTDNGDVVSAALRQGLRKRICPHCGKPIPAHAGEFPTFVVAMLGYVGSGKTSYICSLIEQSSKIAVANSGWSLTYERDASMFDASVLSAYKDKGVVPTVRNSKYYACFTLSNNRLSNEREGAVFIFRDAAGEDLNSSEYMTNNALLFSSANALICFTDLKNSNESRGLDAYAAVIGTAVHAANRPVTMCVINKADLLAPALKRYTSAHMRLKFNRVSRLIGCLDEESHSLLEASSFAKINFAQIFTTVNEVASEVIFYPVISTYMGSYENVDFTGSHASTVSAFTLLAKMLGLSETK